MKKTSLVALASVIGLLSFGCGGPHSSHHKLNEKSENGFIETPKTHTVLYVPESVAAEPRFDEAIHEVDMVVGTFEVFFPGFEGKLKIIRFHEDVEGSDDLRAQYVGDGTILACYHRRGPHLFCLNEAFVELLREEYPNPSEGVLEEAEVMTSDFLRIVYNADGKID